MRDIVEEDFLEFKVGCVSPYNCNHTYLGHNGGYSSYKRFYIRCSECAKDPEQYGDGIFKLTPRGAHKEKSCYCYPTGLKPNKHHYDIRVRRLCKEYNYTFNGYEGDVINSTTKLNLTCDKGHNYNTTSISKFLSCGRKCPFCANTYKRNYTEQKVLNKILSARGGKYTYKGLHKVSNNRDKFTAICHVHGGWITDLYHHTVRKQDCPHDECRFGKISEVKASNTEDFVYKAKLVHGDSYDYSGTVYDRVFKPVEILCKSCNKIFTQRASDHLSGCGCNLCTYYKQRQVYIFYIEDNGVPIAIKTGKAVNYGTRLNRQASYSIFDVKVYGVWETKDYDECKLVEQHLNKNFQGGFLNVNEYKDGYTETRDICLLSDIENYLDSVARRIKLDEL